MVPACPGETHLSLPGLVSPRVSPAASEGFVGAEVPGGAVGPDSWAVSFLSQSGTAHGIWAQFATHHLITEGLRMGST